MMSSKLLPLIIFFLQSAIGYLLAGKWLAFGSLWIPLLQKMCFLLIFVFKRFNAPEVTMVVFIQLHM